MREKPVPLLERISINPAVCSGKPVIRGTRILLTNILSMLGAGYAFERVQEAYPGLGREDMSVAVEYARAVIDVEAVQPGG